MESTRDTVLNSCFNLMRRLSPNDIGKNVAGLANLINDENLKYEVIQKIDQPLGKWDKQRDKMTYRGWNRYIEWERVPQVRVQQGRRFLQVTMVE